MYLYSLYIKYINKKHFWGLCFIIHHFNFFTRFYAEMVKNKPSKEAKVGLCCRLGGRVLTGVLDLYEGVRQDGGDGS